MSRSANRKRGFKAFLRRQKGLSDASLSRQGVERLCDDFNGQMRSTGLLIGKKEAMRMIAGVLAARKRKALRRRGGRERLGAKNFNPLLASCRPKIRGDK